MKNNKSQYQDMPTHPKVNAHIIEQQNKDYKIHVSTSNRVEIENRKKKEKN